MYSKNKLNFTEQLVIWILCFWSFVSQFLFVYTLPETEIEKIWKYVTIVETVCWLYIEVTVVKWFDYPIVCVVKKNIKIIVNSNARSENMYPLQQAHYNISQLETV